MRLSQRQKFWLSALVGTIVAVVLYWPALSLPLMFDDLLHIRLADAVDFRTVWLPSMRFGFYRPFVFLPFLVMDAIFGRFPTTLLHALNLIQHALNCFLLAWLVWRLWQSSARALAAGIFLATYPFAYQAVAMYGNNIYPTSAGLLLALLHLFLTVIRGGNRRWLVATSVLFAIGLLSHETVVLFGPLGFLLAIVERRQSLAESLRNRLALGFTAVGALYIFVYQFLPIGGGPSGDLGTTALLPKLLYLLQTMAYPVAWFASLTTAVSESAVWIGFGLIGTLSLWAVQRGRWRGVLFGWGWWLLACAVIGVNLPTYYILHGARLVYLSGVGAALIWAIVLGELWEQGRFGRIFTIATLLFVTFIGWQFVRDRLYAFHDIAAPVHAVEQVAADIPAEEGILLVNLPAWTAPIPETFPIGVEYVTLMGFHLFAEELIVHNVGGNRPVLAVDAPDLLSNPPYAYGIHDQAQVDLIAADWNPSGSHVFITRYLESGIETSYAGAFLPHNGADPAATLGGYALGSATAHDCDGSIAVELAWDVVDSAEISPAASLFVQLLNADGVLIAQSDGAPLGLNPASYQLPADWQIIDRRTLTPENGVGATLLIGSYDFTTGERFLATDAQDQPLPDNAFSLSVTSCDSG